MGRRATVDFSLSVKIIYQKSEKNTTENRLILVEFLGKFGGRLDQRTISQA